MRRLIGLGCILCGCTLRSTTPTKHDSVAAGGWRARVKKSKWYPDPKQMAHLQILLSLVTRYLLNGSAAEPSFAVASERRVKSPSKPRGESVREGSSGLRETWRACGVTGNFEARGQLFPVATGARRIAQRSPWGSRPWSKPRTDLDPGTSRWSRRPPEPQGPANRRDWVAQLASLLGSWLPGSLSPGALFEGSPLPGQSARATAGGRQDGHCGSGSLGTRSCWGVPSPDVPFAPGS